MCIINTHSESKLNAFYLKAAKGFVNTDCPREICFDASTYYTEDSLE